MFGNMKPIKRDLPIFALGKWRDTALMYAGHMSIAAILMALRLANHAVVMR